MMPPRVFYWRLSTQTMLSGAGITLRPMAVHAGARAGNAAVQPLPALPWLPLDRAPAIVVEARALHERQPREYGWSEKKC